MNEFCVTALNIIYCLLESLQTTAWTSAFSTKLPKTIIHLFVGKVAVKPIPGPEMVPEQRPPEITRQHRHLILICKKLAH